MSSDLEQTDLAATLQSQFGLSDFLPGQQQVMEHLLEGRSTAAVFPTGGGKSLCYQLPALLLPGATLVVSPLIALMKDQIDALAVRGIAAARLDSTLSLHEYRNVMDGVREGRLKLLYVAPERFSNERFREALSQIDISLFAVDEAHCISEWGHNFRPDYLKLAYYAKTYRAERVLALTATATPQVLDDICRLFAIPNECAVRTGFYRPNLTLLASSVAGADRDRLLIERLRRQAQVTQQAGATHEASGATIVYVTLQKTAERVAQRLAADGFPAQAYHAGMHNDRRAEVQEWFMDAQSPIVVATIAFGMGIDKADIRHVYHYNLPKSLESYSQEIGRAGRDGQPSTCEMLVVGEDLHVLETFVYGDTPGSDDVLQLVAYLFEDALGDVTIGGGTAKGNGVSGRSVSGRSASEEGGFFDVSEQQLSRDFDIRGLVVRTLLTYLELEGYLEGGTPFYSQYKFKPLVASDAILADFDDRRKQFLSNLFRLATKGRTWFTLDVDAAAKQLETPRERIVRALDFLAERGFLELRSAGVRRRYRRLRSPEHLEQLATDLHARMVQREQRELARLQQVLDWAGHDQCQVRALGAYFGDPLDEPCGHCSWCHAGGKATALPDRPTPSIDDDLWRQAAAFRQRHPQNLGDPRRFALFLCGVTSPWLVRDKLTREELFGALAHMPFHAVRDRAESA